MSDFESDIYFSLRMGISPNSHIPHIDHNHLERYIISSSDNSDSEIVYGNSMEEGAFFSDSLESILSIVKREMKRVGVPMPHSHHN